VAEIDDQGVVTHFIYASRSHVPDLMVKSGVAYRLLVDQLGSVRMVVRVSDGVVMQEIAYDPWGVPALVSGDWDVQPFGFAGGLYDSETGLVRFGARDYDAVTGRWVAKDPIRFDAGYNLYAYATNGPVNSTDDSGLAPSRRTCYLWCGVELGFCLVSPIPNERCFERYSYCIAICDRQTPPPPDPPNCFPDGSGGSEGSGGGGGPSGGTLG
jgi:RHS repeat-associated protein